MKPIPFSPDWALPSNASEAPTPSALPRLDQPAQAIAMGGLMPIVVAEDDPISRALLADTLEKAGYHVILTGDGHEAMAAIRALSGPALAVIDWMMPGMDGTEVCRRVREANKLVYIILLTARGGKERIVEGLQSGADDYLTKPFDKEELRARLQVGARGCSPAYLPRLAHQPA